MMTASTNSPPPQPAIVHYLTQNGQSYGSVRRCCERCGLMCIEPFTGRVVATYTDQNPANHQLPNDGFVWCTP